MNDTKVMIFDTNLKRFIDFLGALLFPTRGDRPRRRTLT